MSAVTATETKYVYEFSEGSREMKDLLGGKGANVAEMTRILGAERVPKGFVITTEACVDYMKAGREPESLDGQVGEAVQKLEEETGKKLGDVSDPLLVSVRSGARESMPGMMDTVLNLGLNDESVSGLAQRTDNSRFAWDSYRRFVQMFGNVVQSIPGDMYESAIKKVKEARGVELDTELDDRDLEELTNTFKQIYKEQAGEDFPQDPKEQLKQAIRAVFDSWNGKRAIEYRRLNRIPDEWGTAVSVQQMVFGNRGDTSGSGVAFTRDERTGEPVPSGDFLINAQGEDVVSGVRNTRDISELSEVMPEVYSQLIEILEKLEQHYKDMQDVEFTVEEGRLYLLQTRDAKRPAQAAVRVAVDMVDEGILSKEEAIASIDADKLDSLLHPTFDPDYEFESLARGVNASPGAAKGEIVFTADHAIEKAADGVDSILVRPFTEADDVAGFHAARGILTSEGGKASHAALVARGMGRPCVAGASSLSIDLEKKEMEVGGKTLSEGDLIAIDGTTGDITAEDVPLVDPEMNPSFKTILGWSNEIKRMGVRANADNPEDSRKAREFGAEGIGLCRTEHMFMDTDRLPKMKKMIMAVTEEDRRAALGELLGLQQEDFEGIFEEMSGLPVTIRLLDPPLHEFLPDRTELEVKITKIRASGEGKDELEQLEKDLHRVRQLEEVNPMLGTRGCRLAVLYPEIYEMQVQAIIQAAAAVKKRHGEAPKVEIMVPLVDFERELEMIAEMIKKTAESVDTEGVEYQIGTMIELPRACLVADRIAEHADFFSFGTNDLTQTALGFSRDDAEANFLTHYLDEKIIETSPFETIDIDGVGRLMEIAVEKARESKESIKLGICGEHGGDPRSVHFCDRVGLDYVSCSPFRVPLARVAAAQATIEQSG